MNANLTIPAPKISEKEVAKLLLWIHDKATTAELELIAMLIKHELEVREMLKR